MVTDSLVVQKGSRDEALLASVAWESIAAAHCDHHGRQRLRSGASRELLPDALPDPYLSLQEVILLHWLLIAQSGGSPGLRVCGAFCRRAAPRASFADEELYPISRPKPRRSAIR